MDAELTGLIDRANDGALLDFVADRIQHDCEFTDPRSLTDLKPEERVVIDVWDSTNIDGGIRYLLACGIDVPSIGRSCDIIGSPRGARIIRDAIGLLPQSRPPRDSREASRLLKELSPQQNRRLEWLSREFAAIRYVLHHRLAAYVRANRKAFLRKARHRSDGVKVISFGLWSKPQPPLLPVPAANASDEEVLAWLRSFGAGAGRSSTYKSTDKPQISKPQKGDPFVSLLLSNEHASPEIVLEYLARRPSFSELRILSLDGASLSESALRSIRKFPQLEILLAGRTEFDDGTVQVIAGLTHLRWVGLEGTAITDAGLAHLAAMKDLERLELDRTAINGTGLGALEGCRKLDRLELRGSLVTNDAMRHIARFPNLRRLNLNETELNDEGVLQLSKLPSLAFLEVHETDITDAAVIHLANLKHLTSLSAGQTKIEGRTLGRLAGVPLKSIELIFMPLGNAALGELAKCTTLERVDLSKTAIDSGSELLKLRSLKSLKRLELPAVMDGKPEIGELERLLPHAEISAGI